MKLLGAREASKAESLPKCHFMQTNFYTKLAEQRGKGYCYKDVKRWTKTVNVFAKDLVIVPIHCHGNHWTLAVVNFASKRFEYYDSLRGGPEQVSAACAVWSVCLRCRSRVPHRSRVPYHHCRVSGCGRCRVS
jgi:Ulp1 family protease